jgi:hypothetical protein
MQNNSFQQIAERQILQLGEGLQHLQQPFLHADAGLYALDFDGFWQVALFRYGIYVPWYISSVKTNNRRTWVRSQFWEPNKNATGDPASARPTFAKLFAL